MSQIFLLILKISGILLAFVFALTLLALVIPVTYTVRAKSGESQDARSGKNPDSQDNKKSGLRSGDINGAQNHGESGAKSVGRSGAQKKKKSKAAFTARGLFSILFLRVSYMEKEAVCVLRIWGVTVFRASFPSHEAGAGSGRPGAKTSRKPEDSGLKRQKNPEKKRIKNAPSDESGSSVENAGKGNAEGNNDDDSFFERLSARIRRTAQNIKRSLKKIKREIKKYRRLIKDRRTKAAAGYTKEALVKLLRHIKPSKFSANVVFGFDSPDRTGNMLAFLSVLFQTAGIRTDAVSIVPDFQKKRLSGNVFARGHFNIIYVAALAVKLYVTREVQFVLRMIKA